MMHQPCMVLLAGRGGSAAEEAEEGSHQAGAEGGACLLVQLSSSCLLARATGCWLGGRLLGRLIMIEETTMHDTVIIC